MCQASESLASIIPLSVARDSPDDLGERSGGRLAIFVFLEFSYSYETQINECFTKSGHDHPSSSFFFTLIGLTTYVIAAGPLDFF
jgi:hypothetical protein